VKGNKKLFCKNDEKVYAQAWQGPKAQFASLKSDRSAQVTHFFSHFKAFSPLHQ